MKVRPCQVFSGGMLAMLAVKRQRVSFIIVSQAKERRVGA